MIQCVVVLAAGTNHRMGGRTPKALLPLRPDDPDGVCFLSRNLDLYRALGVQRIYLVVSPVGRAEFARFAADDVELVVVNDIGGPSGSSVSMAAGLDALLRRYTEGARTLVTDADVVYERALLEDVGKRSESTLVTIDRISGDGEEVRVYGRSERDPLLIGKGLVGPLVADLRLLGESLGLILLNPAEVRLAAEVVRWIVGGAPYTRAYGFSGRHSEHEEVWQYLFNLDRLAVTQLDGNLLFSECDFPEDLEYIRRKLYPAILERDARVMSTG